MTSNILEKPLVEVVSLLRSKSLSRSELLKSCYKRIEKIKPLNAFVSVLPSRKQEKSTIEKDVRSNKLEGIPFSIKDNYSTKNIATTCASMMLKDYVPAYDATVVSQLKTNGGTMVGKTNMDEYAMGSGTVYSIFGPSRNPWGYDFQEENPSDWHISGGSSGGSAVAVATGASYFALGSDTGGSVRIPAAHCGVIGLKPTYGSISRHGLISLANTFDVPGIFTRTVDDVAYIFNILSCHDELDSTSSQTKSKPVNLKDEEKVADLVIGIPKEYYGPELSSDILNAWIDTADKLSNAGAKVIEVSMPHTQFARQCYHVLACAEIASNFARYDGLEYGLRLEGSYTEEMYARSRNDGFNETVRARIMAGNYFLLRENYRRYYDKALRVRRLVTNDFHDLFNRGVDVLLTPATISTAPLYSEFVKKSNYFQTTQHDVYTKPSNVAGVPAVSVPIRLSHSNLPICLQLISNKFREDVLLKAAKFLETEYKFPCLHLDLD